MYCMISSWPVSPGEAIVSLESGYWRVHGVVSPGMESPGMETSSTFFLGRGLDLDSISGYISSS